MFPLKEKKNIYTAVDELGLIMFHDLFPQFKKYSDLLDDAGVDYQITVGYSEGASNTKMNTGIYYLNAKGIEPENLLPLMSYLEGVGKLELGDLVLWVSSKVERGLPDLKFFAKLVLQGG